MQLTAMDRRAFCSNLPQTRKSGDRVIADETKLAWKQTHAVHVEAHGGIDPSTYHLPDQRQGLDY